MFYKFKLEDAERFAEEMGIRTKLRGNELIFGSCPYCGAYSNDKDKFSINVTTGQFHCFRATCEAKGNMVTLSQDFNFSLGRDVDAYYRDVKQYRNLDHDQKPDTRQAAVDYMKSRGISEAVTKRYHITVRIDNEKILVFPFYDENGKLRYVKYRKTDFNKEKDKNKEWCEKDCKPILFGMDHCNTDNDTLVLTEGQIDSLSVTEAGVENAVSVPNGANGFTWAPHCWDFLKKFQKLVVFGDHENDHITLLDEMSQRFDGMVLHVRPEDYRGCKDANELLQRYGKQAVLKAVQNAVPVEHPQILSLATVERVDLGSLEKFSSGLPSLDRILGGFYMGQLVLITGERGEGKSTLASQFGTFALKAGHAVFFYSGELMSWYFKAWFDGQVAGEDHINRKVCDSGFVDYSVDGAIMPNIESWYRDRVYVYDNDALGERGDILKTMEVAIKQYGCRVLVVDNLMTAMVDDTSVDQFRQQTIFVNALAKMAKQYNVVIFLVAHPRKKTGFGFDNDDVAGSSNITNLVDVVIRYAKPKGNGISEDTMERELTVLKNRLTGVTNRKGIRLFFQEKSKRISESVSGFGWELGWEHPMTESEEQIASDGTELSHDDIPFE